MSEEEFYGAWYCPSCGYKSEKFLTNRAEWMHKVGYCGRTEECGGKQPMYIIKAE